MGNNTSADSSAPVAVTTTGVLSGKTITQVAAISWNSLVLSSDGTVYGWGLNSYGVLATVSGVPVATAGKPLPLDVTFGGNAVTVFNQTNNSFQFISPAHNVGFVDMDIAATDYTAAAHASNIYEYVLPPVINSINPNTGYTTGGDSVTIFGKNFSSDNIVTFNGLPATVTNVSYDGDSITVIVPSHYAGNVDVVVSDILGQKSTFKNGFTYIEDPPTVTSISPASGPEKGSQSVTINGTNFIKKYKFTSFSNGSAAYHTCGIDDGKVYCWGLNDHGQIGDGTGTSQASPVAVTTSGALAGKTITQVAVGIYHTVALTSDGTVYTWGNNEYGQLGNNTTTSSNVPVAVTTTGALSGKTIIQVAAGYEHTVALASDGTVYTWGLNNYGQLGNGTTGSSSTPIAVVTSGTPMDGKNIVDVSVGQYHTVALSSDGTVYAWGYNNYGQLGNNSTTNSSIPVAVTSTGVLSGKTIIQVTAGCYHTVVLASDGTVYAWGYNNFGQLGNGTTGSSSTPIAVVTSGTPMGGKNIINIAAGGYHTVTLASDSTVYTWGYNSYGQIGNGTSTNSLIPVAVTTSGALSGKSITNVYATLYSSYALVSNDVPYSWGYNGLGQLGDDTTTNRTTPVAVDLSNVPYTIPNDNMVIINLVDV